MKANQGMRQPQLGGIGSRFDVPMARPLCSHDEMWRLKGGGNPWRCVVCHPPAVSDARIERSQP